jgi:PAS domain S-box-containing protein
VKLGRSLVLLFLIMTIVSLAIGGIAIGVLYNTAVEEQRRRLVEIAQSQARLLEAMARFQRDFSDYPQGPDAGAIAQIRQAHKDFKGLGKTGEFTLARLAGDEIQFVLKLRHSELEEPRPVAVDSGLAEPMRRALAHQSGSVIGLDYRGVKVLAAYEPVALLDLGIVAKIDMSEIRAPFIRAASLVAFIALVLIALGTYVFFAVSEPIIRRIREDEARFRELFNSMSSGAAVFRAVDAAGTFVYRDLNRAGEKIDNVRREELLGKELTKIFPRAKSLGFLGVLERVWKTGRPEHFPFTLAVGERIFGCRETYVYKLPSGEVVALYEDVTDRKRAERGLQESEERFRTIAESANDAIVSIDSSGTVISWNAAAERIFGYSAKEIMGEPLKKLVPTRYQDAHAIEMAKAVAGKAQDLTGQRVELEGIRKNGSEVPIELSLSTWRQGGERYFTGIIRDISERKRTEKALSDSEGRLRSIIQMQSVAILVVDEQHVVTFVNKAAEMLFGKPSQDLVGAEFGYSLVAGEVAEIEILRPENSLAVAEMQAIPTQWEGKAQFLIFLRDVSAQRRAEGDLRKLFQAIEQSPASVVITDLEGRIEYVNPKFTDTTGYTYAEVAGKNPRVLKSGDTPRDDYKNLWETIKSGKVWRGEFHNKRKNGELFWELASIAPVRDARGRVTHYVAVKEDITDRKATEERLREVQRLEVVGQLTGGVAHDFNNLLGIILGNLQLLDENPNIEGEDRQLIADAIWSAERGSELTHRLLAFARRQQLHPKITDLNQVVGEMTGLLRRTMGEAIEIREVLDPDSWNTMIDTGQLESALLNMAVNARDAMPSGGTLTIATSNTVVEKDAPGAKHEAMPGDYATLAVTDTGTGMPPEVVRRIFEPFFTTKKFGEGSGLGMSMVYGFVRQSGGYLTVNSAVGKGTTITLYLPKVNSANTINRYGQQTHEQDIGDS